MFVVIAVVILICVVPAPAQVQASCSSKTFLLPAPFDGEVVPLGINRYGIVVGTAVASDSRLTSYGFIRYADGTWKTYMAPGASDTYFYKRNESGVTVGSYNDSNTGVAHGLVYYNGKAQTLDHPGSSGTYMSGINKYGSIVGEYLDSASGQHGFLVKNGRWSSIKFPGAVQTNPMAISDSGVIVGEYRQNIGSRLEGFVFQNGVYKTVYEPYQTGTRTLGTTVTGINAYGVMVGTYVKTSGGQGFIFKNGIFEDVNVPNSVGNNAFDVNIHGQVTGQAFSASGILYGFIATCK